MAVRLCFIFYYFPMQNQDTDSGINTILIVIILMLLVGFIVWWFTMRTDVTSTPTDNGSDIYLDVNLPDKSNGANNVDSTSPSTNDTNP